MYVRIEIKEKEDTRGGWDEWMGVWGGGGGEEAINLKRETGKWKQGRREIRRKTKVWKEKKIICTCAFTCTHVQVHASIGTYVAMVTYSVASWVMLLKVYGAKALMLLLLRSLCRQKLTWGTHTNTYCMHPYWFRKLENDVAYVHSVQGYVRGTYTSDSCFRFASSLGTDVSILPSK